MGSPKEILLWKHFQLRHFCANHNEIPDTDIFTKGAEAAELPTVGTVFLGVFVTLLPKLVPRMLPMFMLDSSPETKSKFADPNYATDSEAMFREKFSENLQMVEDIITSFGDDADRVEKSQEYSGFQKFLFTSLETLDIDVSDYIGGLEIDSIKYLGRLARGEDRMSPYYSMIAEALIGLGSIVFGS